MRVLWTIVKVALGIAILVPVTIIVLSIAVGVLGALVGLAVAVLKLAAIGLVIYGVFRLGAMLFGWSSPSAAPVKLKELPLVDPYYEAAKRELDNELGEVGR